MGPRRWVVLAILAVLTGVLFNTPGTGDFVNWLQWADTAERLGLREGFRTNESDYPPLTTLFSLASVLTGRLVGLSAFHSIKVGILLFQVLCAAIIFTWTRRSSLAIGYLAASFLNTVPHGYVDAVAAAPLLIGFWALVESQPVFAAVCLTIAVFTKLQPLAVGPFLVVHVVGRILGARPRVNVVASVARVAIPVLLVAGGLTWAFGGPATLAAFDKGMSHRDLSGNALNFNWIVTHLLRAFHPLYEFDGLEDGRANLIVGPPWWTMALARAIFGAAYVATLVFYSRRPKTARNLLKFSLLGYLAFFTFNPGLHENHLYLAVVLAIVLVSIDPHELWPAVFLALMTNVNMFLFEGIDGDDVMFRRVVAGLDLALPLSVVEVSFFCWYWWREVRPSPQLRWLPERDPVLRSDRVPVSSRINWWPTIQRKL